MSSADSHARDSDTTLSGGFLTYGAHCKYVIWVAFRAERRKLVPHWPSNSANGGGVTKPRHIIHSLVYNPALCTYTKCLRGSDLETRIKIHCTCEKILISPPQYNTMLRLGGVGSRSSSRLFVSKDRYISILHPRPIFTETYCININHDHKYSRSHLYEIIPPFECHEHIIMAKL